ncbi:hypothetical protein [Isosphaera pallida]|uniref:hypothetical protein n=1 Tax=Isosphaera pallida TaxID=128 RepID=UPI0002DB624D|nr:hypothetical protein [Isosphaera pallida]
MRAPLRRLGRRTPDETADPLDRATTSLRRIAASIRASRGGIGGQVAAASP